MTKLHPQDVLNKAFLKVTPNRERMGAFTHGLIRLIDQVNEAESEEFHKNLLSDFLKAIYYSPRN
ncbi:MAG: hypothetical protein VKL20_08285 [Synechocystis sp.]|nr:hypothetical protein [Synechocystis sp.]